MRIRIQSGFARRSQCFSQAFQDFEQVLILAVDAHSLLVGSQQPTRHVFIPEKGHRFIDPCQHDQPVFGQGCNGMFRKIWKPVLQTEFPRPFPCVQTASPTAHRSRSRP